MCLQGLHACVWHVVIPSCSDKWVGACGLCVCLGTDRTEEADTCPPNRHCWGIGPEPAPHERDHEAAEHGAGGAAEGTGAHPVAAHQRGHHQRAVGEGQPAPQTPGAGTEDEGGEGQPEQGAAEVQG